MLRYYQVLLYTVIPPIAALGYLYSPLLGRRDGIKIGWLAFMATLWTTPWDNWIISRGAWSYPPHSVLFKIINIPIEEHAFFILQPLLLILLHNILTLGYMIPYRVPKHIRETTPALIKTTLQRGAGFPQLQTLPHRYRAAGGWMSLWLLGLLLLIWPTNLSSGSTNLSTDTIPALLHTLRHGLTINTHSHSFYLGCILAWITPVIALLTLLGARGFMLKGGRWTYILGIGYLWIVDTIGIRSGAWHINEQTTLGINLWRGLPIEEAIFFVLTTHLIILSSSLISHAHNLMLLTAPLDPTLYRWTAIGPPSRPLHHILSLSTIVFRRPTVDEGVLQALWLSEDTLRRGSKSFTLAKLGWGREMRCGLVAVYSWCRVTDNLIDESTSRRQSLQMLQMMKDFLHLVYSPATATATPTTAMINEFICSRVPETAVPAFYLFSKLLPGIIPRNAFDDLIKGYEMDLSFSVGDEGNEPAVAATAAGGMSNGRRRRDSRQSIMERSPIKTEYDLVIYADRVAGSVADMICHLAWAILDPEGGQGTNGNAERIKTLAMARQMGQALQFVNIARDIRTDALLHRLYIPLTMFTDRQQDLEALFNKPETLVAKDYARYTLPLLGIANTLRTMSAGDIENLPRTARAGTRAMVASYFEIGKEIERRGGALDSERLKVSKWRRLGAVLRCFWGWDQARVSRGLNNASK